MKHILLVVIALLFLFSDALTAQKISLDPVVGEGFGSVMSKESSLRRLSVKPEDIGSAFRAGLGLSIRVTNRLSISSGLRYASLSSKRKVESSDLRWGSQWNGEMFDPTTPSGEPSNSLVTIESTSLLELPIEIRAKFSDALRGFYIQGGVVPALHLRSGSRINRNSERGDFVKAPKDFFSSYWLGATASLGYEYLLISEGKVSAFAQLGSTFQLLEEYTNSQSRRWDAGALVGFRVQL